MIGLLEEMPRVTLRSLAPHFGREFEISSVRRRAARALDQEFVVRSALAYPIVRATALLNSEVNWRPWLKAGAA